MPKIALCLKDFPLGGGGRYVMAGTEIPIDADDFIQIGERFTQPRLHPHFFRIIEPEPWKPKQGELYFFVTNGCTVTTAAEYFATASDRVAPGNFFQSKEKAEAAAVKIRALFQEIKSKEIE